jgi:hypothetical protein
MTLSIPEIPSELKTQCLRFLVRWQLPTQRSATPFCRGLWIEVCKPVIGSERMAPGTSRPYFWS